MPSLVQDLLNASIVFLGIELMNKPQAGESLRAATDAEVVGSEVGFSVSASGAPESARRFILPRDRISLDITSGRSSVTMEYPPDDFAQLAKVIACAIDNTEEGQRPAAFGYNMILVLDSELTEPAVKLLGNRLITSQSLGRESWDRIGGLGAIYFQDGLRRWTFNVEPRPREDLESKKLFMSVNLHLPNEELPAEQVVVETFSEMLNEARSLANQIIGD